MYHTEMCKLSKTRIGPIVNKIYAEVMETSYHWFHRLLFSTYLTNIFLSLRVYSSINYAFDKIFIRSDS